jgi:hypothetical protein
MAVGLCDYGLRSPGLGCFQGAPDPRGDVVRPWSDGPCLDGGHGAVAGCFACAIVVPHCVLAWLPGCGIGSCRAASGASDTESAPRGFGGRALVSTHV